MRWFPSHCTPIARPSAATTRALCSRRPWPSAPADSSEPDRLERKRDTEPQTSLPRRQRLLNMRGALRATRTAAGVRLLLVDDVTTTGATLDPAASALKLRGAAWVGALVMARQPLTPPDTLG